LWLLLLLVLLVSLEEEKATAKSTPTARSFAEKRGSG
jgi:hypothetical protein